MKPCLSLAASYSAFSLRVALRPGLGNGLDHGMALHGLQAVEFFAQQSSAPRLVSGMVVMVSISQKEAAASGTNRERRHQANRRRF